MLFLFWQQLVKFKLNAARNQIRKVAQQEEGEEREGETHTLSGVCFGFNQQKDKRHKVFPCISFYFAVLPSVSGAGLQMKMSGFAVQSKEKNLLSDVVKNQINKAESIHTHTHIYTLADRE